VGRPANEVRQGLPDRKALPAWLARHRRQQLGAANVLTAYAICAGEAD
jgi:hypothetical protein